MEQLKQTIKKAILPDETKRELMQTLKNKASLGMGTITQDKLKDLIKLLQN